MNPFTPTTLEPPFWGFIFLETTPNLSAPEKNSSHMAEN